LVQSQKYYYKIKVKSVIKCFERRYLGTTSIATSVIYIRFNLSVSYYYSCISVSLLYIKLL